MKPIHDASGNLIGYSEEASDGSMRFYGSDGAYRGYSNNTGTYDSREGFVCNGNNGNLLLTDRLR